MSYFFRYWILVITMVVLGGCDASLLINDYPKQFVMERYGVDGQLLSKVLVSDKDPTYNNLKSILNQDKSGWQRSYASYKTGAYILRSEKLIVRCYPDRLIVDVIDTTSSNSFAKNIPNLFHILGLQQ